MSLIRRTIRLLNYTEVSELEDPEIVPACGGGVQIEWYLGDRELEVEFMSDGRIEYLATDNQTDRCFEDEMRCIDDLRFWVGWVAHEDQGEA